MQVKKILIVRFSSIGDIVLTTPVVRCLKQQLKGAEVHFVTKEIFRDTLVHNPYLDKLHTFKKDVAEIYSELKAEKFDLIIDLHKNLRSLRLKQTLGVKSYSFNKINLQKFAAVNFKMIGSLPDKHIVERYFETVEKLGVKPDEQGLDYYISKNDHVNVSTLYLGNNSDFVSVVAGGSYFTKQIPLNKLAEICSRVKLPVILLGGPTDKQVGDELKKQFPGIINLCGALSLNQSASVISQSSLVISSDTGLMHIAAAFGKRIISIWGNTIPEFGMGPYKPNSQNQILEVKGLSCRPCSKLGFKKCPKGHFKCMNDIDTTIFTSV
ncbi:MAG: glycosyl transferase family 9 [Bacteroidetes bacterium]|jgi:ADP-heptose:LPS heptosyltransferase|nr:glycosyl transferase family 9 [Bacteroidota bacterium]